MLTTIVCPIKTITKYDSLPTIAAKYTHAQNVFTVTKRVKRSQSIVIIQHKYMLMCNHKIRINLMCCLRNSTTRCEIGQLVAYFYPETAQRWVLKCNLRAHNCWISLSEGTTQPNEVG